jgi:hypothetical protein
MAAMTDRRHDVDRFGRWASTYDRSYLQRVVLEPVPRATLQAASRELPRPGRVLESGLRDRPTATPCRRLVP